MENSHRIEAGEPLFSDGKAYALAAGEGATRRSAAARIALQLENAMVREGWEEGRTIASERGLAQHFGTTRETMREAARILERRGSMRMVRGRFGGLAAARPGPEPAAASIALYLRARGCPSGSIGDAIALVDPILARAAAGSALCHPHPAGGSVRAVLAAMAGNRGLMLYAALADLFAPPPGEPLARALLASVDCGDGELAEALAGKLPRGGPGAAVATETSDLRSVRIAGQLLDRILAAGASGGWRIGSEWDLGCEFDTCRSTIRQALGMLEDLDLVEARRGRGGGYVVKRPSPSGAIRHAHLFLTLGPPDALPVMRVVDELNIVHLKLAAARLAPLSMSARRRRLAGFIRFAVEGDPHIRFLKVLEELGRIADNPLVDTMLRCVIAAQARARMMDSQLPEPVQACILSHHEQVAEALVRADLEAAERHFRAVQQALWSICPVGPAFEPAALHPIRRSAQ